MRGIRLANGHGEPNLMSGERGLNHKLRIVWIVRLRPTSQFDVNLTVVEGRVAAVGEQTKHRPLVEVVNTRSELKTVAAITERPQRLYLRALPLVGSVRNAQ